MNNVQNPTEQILSSAPSISSFKPAIETTTSSPLNLFSNIDWKIWVFIIIILAVLGVNIFVYLAEITQYISKLVSPLTNYLGNNAIDTSKQIVNVSAQGANAGINVAAGTITTGLDVVQQTASSIKGHGSDNLSNSELVSNTTSSQIQQAYNNDLNNVLNNAVKQKADSKVVNKDDIPTYEADDSYSIIQASKSSGKSGWCFIGEDRGFRSCIEVGDNDKCISGDIFPTKEICINPNLRK